MEEKRDYIFEIVTKLVKRANVDVSEKQVNAFVDEIMKLGDIKTVVDYLALKVGSIFEKGKFKKEFEESMCDLCELGAGVYSSKEAIVTQMEENKGKNYVPR